MTPRTGSRIDDLLPMPRGRAARCRRRDASFGAAASPRSADAILAATRFGTALVPSWTIRAAAAASPRDPFESFWSCACGGRGVATAESARVDRNKPHASTGRGRRAAAACRRGEGPVEHIDAPPARPSTCHVLGSSTVPRPYFCRANVTSSSARATRGRRIAAPVPPTRARREMAGCGVSALVQATNSTR